MPFFVQLPQLIEDNSSPQYIDIIDGQKTAVQRELRRSGLGGYEPIFQASILTVAGMVRRPMLLDIGAHIGFYSALISAIYPNALGVAFEPTPETHAIAKSIRDINNLSYFIAHRAISNVNENLTFYLSPKGESSNSLNAAFRPGAKKSTVRALSLDSYMKGGVPAPNIIKIDVETHEPQVLQGARETIAHSRPWIFCELLPSVNRENLAIELQALEGFGYRFYNMSGLDAWQPRSAQGVIDVSENFENRDWLFSPQAINDSFFAQVHAWADALQRCGKETNRTSVAQI